MHSLAKIQVTATFLKRDMGKDLQRFVWRRHAGAHPDGQQHGGRKPTETSVTEFCYKSVNVSLKNYKRLK